MSAPASPEATVSAAPIPSASARPVNPNAPRVAIIIDDCGQWLQTERGYLALPIPLTLAVLPHVPYTSLIANEASAAGKGVMLHLPMEPISHIYPGPGEIKTGMTDAQVTAQTQDDIAQVPLAAGFNNHEGSEATSDPRIMNDVIAVAKSHNLFFIDSRTSAKSIGEQVAEQQGVPTASRDIFLDNRADVAYTESMLEQTVDVALKNGSAIAIGHPRPTTLEALRDMYPQMEARGIQFVLASSLTH